MPVRIFKVPEESSIFAKTNKPLLATAPALQAIKGVSFNMPPIEFELPVGGSFFGTPVMDKLEFPKGSYVDLEGNTINFAGISIEAIILEVSQSKNIVKESIQGRNGTVKEYVSDGDFVINARGFISNIINAIPLSTLRDFKEIMQVPQQLDVVSQYLNEIFEINQIVIESYAMPQQAGVRNEIPFSFNALSDVALDLEELE